MRKKTTCGMESIVTFSFRLHSVCHFIFIQYVFEMFMRVCVCDVRIPFFLSNSSIYDFFLVFLFLLSMRCIPFLSFFVFFLLFLLISTIWFHSILFSNSCSYCFRLICITWMCTLSSSLFTLSLHVCMCSFFCFVSFFHLLFGYPLPLLMSSCINCDQCYIHFHHCFFKIFLLYSKVLSFFSASSSHNSVSTFFFSSLVYIHICLCVLFSGSQFTSFGFPKQASKKTTKCNATTGVKSRY